MAIQANDGDSVIHDVAEFSKALAGAVVLAIFIYAAKSSVDRMINNDLGFECRDGWAVTLTSDRRNERPWVMGTDGPQHGERSKADWDNQLTCIEAETALAAKYKKGNG